MNFDGKKIIAKPNASTYDIIEALINITPTAINQVKPNIKELVIITGDPKKDALTIAKFIRKNIKYKADGYENQNIQLPGRILNDTKIGDCKSFSLLFCSMMQAAGHKAGYRFASYRKNKIPTHVYNWVLDNNKNLYIFDTCVSHLKESPRHTYIKDMDVNYMTGNPEIEYISKRGRGKKLFKGVKKIALSGPRQAFRGLVALNVRGLASRLDKANKKDNVKVMKLWQKLGGEYNKLMQSVNTGKNKKPLLGEKKGVNGLDNEYIYLGEPVTAATLIASASAILIPVSKLLKDLNIGDEGTGEEVITTEEETEAAETGNKITNPDFEVADPDSGVKNLTTSSTSSGSFKPSPLLIGGVIGAGVLIYLLTKKKK